MRTIQTTVYKFSELNEEAKERAINENANINVLFEWWESVYDDAGQIGLKISSFDIDRASYCNGKLIDSMNETIDKILTEHGEICDTYKLAKEYREKWDALVLKHSDGVNTEVVHEDNEYEFDQEADEMEEDFCNELCENYLSILKKEYEYLTSKEAIIESIEANGYEFTEEGETI